MKDNKTSKKESLKKYENNTYSNKKEGQMARKKNKTIWGVIGVLLTLFGIIGTIPILISKEYIAGLPITAISVVVGIILMAWAFSD